MTSSPKLAGEPRRIQLAKPVGRVALARSSMSTPRPRRRARSGGAERSPDLFRQAASLSAVGPSAFAHQLSSLCWAKNGRRCCPGLVISTARHASGFGILDPESWTWDESRKYFWPRAKPCIRRPSGVVARLVRLTAPTLVRSQPNGDGTTSRRGRKPAAPSPRSTSAQ
jgi:hypothetical protein